MESFYRTHAYLVEHTNAPVRRDLMDEIDWSDRLIGIKGTRGVGKTTFLLQYAKEKFGTDRSCLFINMNNFYFSGHSIVDFANEFQKRGGKVLLIDQVFKHPEWSKELRIVLITMFSFNLLLMLFMILFPSTVASAFTSDERLIETVRWTMPVFLGGMTIFGLQRACQNMFVALGQARISIFIALLRKAILLIPLALILPHFMGVTGVYAAEAISDATAAICCTLLFFWQFPKILGKIQGNTLRTS